MDCRRKAAQLEVSELLIFSYPPPQRKRDRRRTCARDREKVRMRIVSILASLVLVGGLGPGTETAEKRAADLEQRAQAAAKAGNHRERIAADLELFHLFNGSPSVIEALARAYAAAGDASRALSELNHFADLGLADEGLLSGTDQGLNTMQALPGYKSVLARLSKNKLPISRANVAFTLSDPGLVAEDIAYDAHSRSFLVTSILKRKILRIGADGSETDFAVSPDRWPMSAIKVDVLRNRVWATEVAFSGFTMVPRPEWGHSAVLCFDLATGKLLEKIEGPEQASLGDLVLTEEGDPIVSDGDGGGLYRISSRRMTKIDGADFISPQTPTMLGRARKLLVPDYLRGIAMLDLGTGRVDWLNEDDIDKVALNGIDGLYFFHQSLIATQNGTSPERVIRFELDPSLTHVVSSTVIEQSVSGGTDPTHGVLVGDYFCYIANSGWAALDEKGQVQPGAKLSAPRIMRYKLS
jgi:hypothetical protein